MADELDPENPIDRLMPPIDNPEFHRKKKEHLDNLASGAEAAVLSDPAHGGLGERLTSVRQGVPQSAAPQPLADTNIPPRTPSAASQEGTGLTVDPSQAQVNYTPVEPTLPAEAAPQAAPSAVPPAAPASVNPILAGLRQDFGIESIPLTDVKVNNHVFTMKVLDVGAVTQALRFADTLSMPGSERENAINLQIALVSFAVLAIDKEPVWKVFDVAVPAESLVMVEGRNRPIFDPMTPPPGVRILGATGFMDFLSGQASSSLLAELWLQYGSKVDPSGSLDSLMESIQDGEIEEPDLPLL